MSALFKSPKIPEIPAPQPPKGLDESAGNAAQAERLRLARAMSYQDTILTGGTLGKPKPKGGGGARQRTVLGG